MVSTLQLQEKVWCEHLEHLRTSKWCEDFPDKCHNCKYNKYEKNMAEIPIEKTTYFEPKIGKYRPNDSKR